MSHLSPDLVSLWEVFCTGLSTDPSASCSGNILHLHTHKYLQKSVTQIHRKDLSLQAKICSSKWRHFSATAQQQQRWEHLERGKWYDLKYSPGGKQQNWADRIWHITQHHMLKANRTIQILQVQNTSLLLVRSWCGMKVSCRGKEMETATTQNQDESTTQLHLFTWSPLAFLN